MRLTKNKQYNIRENYFSTKRKNIRVSDNSNINQKKSQNNSKEQGGIYLQKILKTNKDYKSINKKIKIDSNNLMNCDKNIQNIFSTDEKRQKAISYIINSINSKSRDKINQLKITRNNYNSMNYKNFQTEQDAIVNSKYQMNDINEFTPKRYENDYAYYNGESNYNRMNIFNNRLRKLNLNYSINNFNNMNMIGDPLTNREFLNQTERNDYNNNLNTTNSQNPVTTEYINNKKYDKKINNRKEEFFKKLKLNNDIKDYKKEKIIKDDNNNAQKIPSPKDSSKKKQYSPFNDILSKSSNNFFINKIPSNNIEKEYLNDLSVTNLDNKSSLTKRIEEREGSFNDNYKTMNPTNSNTNLLKINNSYIQKNNIIYRNKRAINQKIFQSNSLKNYTAKNKFSKKNYICINSGINKLSEKENEDKILYRTNEEEDNNKNININKEELKKYLEYFIKDITPININQFVIYSHSNNNYKNEKIQKPADTNEIFSMNKSYTSLNKSQDIKFNDFNVLNSKKENILNNSTYMQEFEHLKLKQNFFNINSFNNNENNKISKIHVKKRPINDNIISHTINNNFSNNTNIDNNYTGLYLCKQNKGDNFLNIPVKINNIEMINKILKEYGFEIKKIKINNSNNNLKKDDSGKKKNYNTNIEIKKLTNIKEKAKKVISGTEYKRLKKCQKIIKNLNNNEKVDKKQKKIFVKLNENFDDFENNYLKKNKEKQNECNNNINYIKNDINYKNIVSTPNFKIN